MVLPLALYGKLKQEYKEYVFMVRYEFFVYPFRDLA